MLGTTGILIAFIVLTIALAVVFLVRSSITVGAAGKILAFAGLCILPVMCIGAGWSVHIQRSQQTASCISCHSMESHGKSLYVADTRYIPAQHFQNHLVPPDQACFTCHTNYAFYGSFENKLNGLRYIYMQYVSSPPKTIHIRGGFPNLACLHCHAGARGFSDNPAHSAIMGSLNTDQISCLTCHDMIHNVSELAHLKMWVPGNAPTSPASAASSPAPATTALAATAEPSKATTASSAGGATAAHGKTIFDSQHCSGCHGASGGGGVGPALTHISSKYSPAKLSALLKAPTAAMKAAGMVPLTLNAADLGSLVTYVTGLGGTSATAAATPPAPGSPSPAPAQAKPTAAAAPSKASRASPAGGANTARGKSIFDSQRCSGCHGASGGGGVGPALTHISSKYPPAQLTALLKAPNAAMKAAGMVPLTLNAADLGALVSYVTSLGGAPAASAATPPASGSSSPAPAQPKPAPAAEPSKVAATATPPASGAPAPAKAGSPAGGATVAKGKSIFDSQRCSGCHGASGGGGVGPALTHISSKYPPAQLTALLKAPNAAMKTAGMVPLTLNAADMEALVTYVTSLGGTSAAAAATPAASGSSSPAPAEAKPAAAAGPSKEESKGAAIFKVHGCADCHGPNGIGGTAAASALAGTGKSLAPAALTTMLRHPTARMQQGGMPPISLSGDELKALVAYVSSISASKSNSH